MFLCFVHISFIWVVFLKGKNIKIKGLTNVFLYFYISIYLTFFFA